MELLGSGLEFDLRHEGRSKEDRSQESGGSWQIQAVTRGIAYSKGLKESQSGLGYIIVCLLCGTLRIGNHSGFSILHSDSCQNLRARAFLCHLHRCIVTILIHDTSTLCRNLIKTLAYIPKIVGFISGALIKAESFLTRFLHYVSS